MRRWPVSCNSLHTYTCSAVSSLLLCELHLVLSEGRQHFVFPLLFYLWNSRATWLTQAHFQLSTGLPVPFLSSGYQEFSPSSLYAVCLVSLSTHSGPVSRWVHPIHCSSLFPLLLPKRKVVNIEVSPITYGGFILMSSKFYFFFFLILFAQMLDLRFQTYLWWVMP